MAEFVGQSLGILTIVFCVASMLNVGLRYSFREVLGPLRDVKSVALVLLANFVAAPAFAWALGTILQLSDEHMAGLLVVGTAAGAPILTQLVALAGGKVAYAGSMMFLLLPATVIYMPIVLPLLISGVHVDAWAVAKPMIFSMLVPLVVGLLVHHYWPSVAAPLAKIAGPLGQLTLVLMLMAVLVSTWNTLTGVLGQRLILAGILYIAGCFGIGYLLSSRELRLENAFSTAQRNFAAVNVVAINSIGDPDTVVAAVVISFMAMFILFPAAGLIQRRKTTTSR